METLNQDLDTISPEAEVQQAYDNAVSNPWTISRQSVAMALGCSILSGVFGPELRGLQERGVYENALHDVVVVAWLLHLTPEEVIRLRVRMNVEQATFEAYAWAETEGIFYGSPKYLDGVKQLTEIVGSIFKSFYAVGGPSKEEPLRKNDIGAGGKSSSPSTPSKRQGKRKAS